MELAENKQKITDEHYMRLALHEAKKALKADEVPIAAILVENNKIIAKAHNKTKHSGNVIGHAEKLVIENALKSKTYLYDATLYVTLEPCLMCCGMIILSRIGRVVYAASDPKAGGAGSIYNALLDKNFNHRPSLTKGILAKQDSL
mgnify:FL=1